MPIIGSFGSASSRLLGGILGTKTRGFNLYPDTIDYLVVAGGGSGGGGAVFAGGGGAGGFRTGTIPVAVSSKIGRAHV